MHQPRSRAAAFACAFVVASSIEAQAKTCRHDCASFYGSGKRTASGEWFDRDGMTAAHRTLPFGTLVRVVNRRNGKGVVVRVNDRGPFRRSRIIDTTPAAFVKIAPRRAGVVPVRLEIGLTVGELRSALNKFSRLITAKEVMRNAEARLLREHDSPWSEHVASPRLPAQMEASAAGAYALAQLPGPMDLEQVVAINPFAMVGNIFRNFVESMLRPIGNCRAFETVDERTRRVVADVAKELGGQAFAFSCYRDVAHNRRVGGARSSQHIRRKALDFRVVKDGKPVAPRLIAQAARRHPLMRHAGGVGTYCGSAVHVDSGPRRNWNWGCGGKKRTRYAYRKQHRG